MDQTSIISMLPSWQCHKVVRAGKITNIEYNADDSATLTVQLDPRSPTIEPIEVLMSDAWMLKHKPGVGGYFVAYDDGYLSFSPAGAFEGGYTIK